MHLLKKQLASAETKARALEEAKALADKEAALAAAVRTALHCTRCNDTVRYVPALPSLIWRAQPLTNSCSAFGTVASRSICWRARAEEGRAHPELVAIAWAFDLLFAHCPLAPVSLAPIRLIVALHLEQEPLYHDSSCEVQHMRAGAGGLARQR